VEGVIAERIGRLSDPLQEALRAASVEGETFTAEVVARVRKTGEGEMVARFSDELERRHRLVSAQGMLRRGDQRLSEYRFRHILFQKYLYDHLDPVKRTRLHEEVGTILEALYGERAEEIAVHLARHFQEAGMTRKAIPYLKQAGNTAVRLSANEEAIAHFTRALELLETLPDTPQRAQQELSLQLGLAAPLQAIRGHSGPEVGRAYARARELCQQIGETPQLFPTLWLFIQFYQMRAEFHTAMELAEQMLPLAQRAGDPLLTALAHLSQGVVLQFVGEFASSRAHVEHMLDFYDPKQHHPLTFIYGIDPGVYSLTFTFWTLWPLGYPDQALKRSQEAIALARELDHPFSLAFALALGASVHLYFLRRFQADQEYVEPLLQLTAKQGLAYYQGLGMACRGWAQAQAGQVEEGIGQLRRAIANNLALGAEVYHPFGLALLAEAYGKGGQAEQGLSVIAEALALMEKTGERYYEAESHRIKGELLQMQDDETEAEVSFRKSIEVAQRQEAKSWELRAATSLSRLWQRQGKREEARQLLAEIYNWFTEGFDTPDLKEAKALLEELS
jgi:predicted ATPase